MLLFCSSVLYGQSPRVAMTIDDVPFEANPAVTFESEARTNQMLLKKIQKAKTPVTAFFTGNKLDSSDTAFQNRSQDRMKILFDWVYTPLITIGNHSEHHLDNSKTDLATFTEEVMKVDNRLRHYAQSNKTTLKYFRFPYNALGKDSADQAAKEQFLSSKGYITTPFTIENVDYIYNAVYIHEEGLGHRKTADSIVQCYLNYTMQCFKEAEDLAQELYGRAIDHIFLFHDLPLNAHCYDKLSSLLRAKNYQFISLEEALRDTVYQSTNYYHGRHGISWLYRWMPDPVKRLEYLRRAPDPDKWVYQEYLRIGEQSK